MWNNEPDVESAKLTVEALLALHAQAQQESHMPPPRFWVSHQTYAHLIQNQDTKCGCPACYVHLGHEPALKTVENPQRMLEQ